MTAVLSIVVAGPPVGASRPRVTARGTFMPRGHVAWERRAIEAALSAYHGPQPRPPLDEPVVVHVTAWHHRPRRLCRRKDPRQAIRATCKPDVDNVAKLVLDALVKARVLVDDTRVAVLHVERWYCPIDVAGAPSDPERVEVLVGTLAEVPT